MTPEQATTGSHHNAEINLDATEEIASPSSRAGRVRLAPLQDRRNGISQAELDSDTAVSMHPIRSANSQHTPDLVDAGTISMELAKELSPGEQENDESHLIGAAEAPSEPAQQEALGAVPHEDIRSLPSSLVAEHGSGQPATYEKGQEEIPFVDSGGNGGRDEGTGNSVEAGHDFGRNDATMWSWRRQQEQETSTREEEQRAKENRAKRVLQVSKASTTTV